MNAEIATSNNIKIEHDIPISPKAGRRGGLAQILRQMKTGDSVILSGRQRNAIFVAGRAMRVKLLSRSVGNGSFRVWRIRAPRRASKKV